MANDLVTKSAPDSMEFNPFMPAHRENPFQFFSWSRAQAPVTYAADLGVWMVTRYSDVVRVLADTTVFSSDISIPHVDRDNPPEVLDILSRTLPAGLSVVQADPPEHGPMRAVFRRLLRGERVNAIEPRAREIAEELVAGFAADGQTDLVEQFCQPFVQRVLGMLVGIPDADIKRVVAWNEDFITLLTPPASLAEKQQAAERFIDYNDYLLELIDQRRRDPREDLISELVHDGSPDQPFDAANALMVIRGAYGAGIHTPVDAIGNAVLDLLTERRHWERAVADPSTIPAAFEETLRRNAPHRGLMRVTTQDTELGGVQLPAGAWVLPLLGSANRDETRFDDPEEFRPNRARARRHLAFGHGIHLCVGAHLARAEGCLALEVLTKHLPTLRLAERFMPTHYPAWFFWGLERLDVTWDT